MAGLLPRRRRRQRVRGRVVNYETLLGVYHFCSAWHGGQFSREYRVMCRTGLVPRGAEEYLETLARPDYASARDVYVALVKDKRKRYAKMRPEESGYVSCVCCGHAVVVDDIEAEDGVTMCDDCTTEDCDPRESCQCGEDGNFDDEEVDHA